MKKFILFLLLFLALTPLQTNAISMADKLVGKLLLQVEQGGRIWYVAPKDKKRYEITFENALPIFKENSTGITNTNLNKIPIAPDSLSNTKDSDNDGYSDQAEAKLGYNPFGTGKISLNTTFGKKFIGKLLLQVEQGGRIWYVDFKGYRWEITWQNLMSIFKKLSIGIKDVDLNKIPDGIMYYDDMEPIYPLPIPVSTNTTNTTTTTNNNNTSSTNNSTDSSTWVTNNTTTTPNTTSSTSANTSTNTSSNYYTPPTQPAQTYASNTTKPAILRLTEDIMSLSHSDIVLLYNSLPSNDRLWFDLNPAFTNFLQLIACQTQSNFVTYSSYSTSTCQTANAGFNDTMKFISYDQFVQNADTARLKIINSYKCSSPNATPQSCNSYTNTSQNISNMYNQTSQAIIDNSGTNNCRIGIDPNCGY